MGILKEGHMRVRFLYTFMMIIINLKLCSVGYTASSSNIVVVVNKDIITAADLEERLRLFNLSTGKPTSTPISQDVRKHIVQGMIEELLQLQAAKLKKIEVTDKDAEASLSGLAKDNNMSLEAMVNMLKSNGISKQTMITRLKAQMSWGRYIRETYGALIHINDKDVDLFLSKSKEIKFEEPTIEEMEVTLSQAIFDLPDTSEETMSVMGPKIEAVHSTQGCETFLKSATEFGAKVDANRKVKFSQLPPPLKPMVQKTQAGTCMQPTMTPDGLVLTMVCTKVMPKLTPAPEPTRDAAWNLIEQEKLGKLATQEMTKLRRTAFIDDKSSLQTNSKNKKKNLEENQDN